MTKKGLDQSALAAQVKVSRATVSKWCRDQTEAIESDNFLRLAVVLGVNARWLGGLEEDPQPWEKVNMDEAEVLAIFRHLEKSGREQLIRQGKFYLQEEGKSPSVIDPYKRVTA